MPCRTCGSPLAADQRYCLECGDRHGPPRLDWKAMTIGTAAVDAAPEQDDGVARGLPSPRVAAGLVLGVLAFGVAVGNAAGPGTSAADAGGRKNITIVASAAPPVAPVAPVALAVPEAVVAPPADEPPAIDEADEADAPAVDDAAPLENSAPAEATAPADDDAPAQDTAPADDTGDATTTDDTATPAPKLPPVKHVWLVTLTGHSYDETFGAASPAPYLASELRAQGTLLPWYHAAGHDPAAGGVALLGGQKDAVGPFDDKVTTLADQLTGAGRTWKAYVEGAATGLAAGDNPCLADAATQPRNPFLRFASITGAAECGSSIAEPAQLATDVADGESAPALSYVVPGPAHDGSTTLADADTWLKATLPTILGSKAYKDGGLVVVTFDAGAPADVEAGGGRVGALLLSPYVTAGGTVEAPYDPYSLLASIEDLFGLDPIGYAAETRLKAFGPKVYGAWTPES
jgi:Phosphoesterase family